MMRTKTRRVLFILSRLWVFGAGGYGYLAAAHRGNESYGWSVRSCLNRTALGSQEREKCDLLPGRRGYNPECGPLKDWRGPSAHSFSLGLSGVSP
jgi:hypothetical protein